MISDGAAQVVDDPVEAALLIRAYLMAIFALLTMTYLKFRAKRDYGASVTYALGLFALIWMVIGTGVLGYDYIFPGAILSAGMSLIMFALGLGIGRIVFGDDSIIEPEEKS